MHIIGAVVLAGFAFLLGAYLGPFILLALVAWLVVLAYQGSSDAIVALTVLMILWVTLDNP